MKSYLLEVLNRVLAELCLYILHGHFKLDYISSQIFPETKQFELSNRANNFFYSYYTS